MAVLPSRQNTCWPPSQTWRIYNLRTHAWTTRPWLGWVDWAVYTNYAFIHRSIHPSLNVLHRTANSPHARGTINQITHVLSSSSFLSFSFPSCSAHASIPNLAHKPWGSPSLTHPGLQDQDHYQDQGDVMEGPPTAPVFSMDSNSSAALRDASCAHAYKEALLLPGSPWDGRYALLFNAHLPVFACCCNLYSDRARQNCKNLILLLPSLFIKLETLQQIILQVDTNLAMLLFRDPAAAAAADAM